MPEQNTDEPKKEGRIAKHSRLAREAWDEPKSILTWSRGWLVSLWITKGGGFYGLGYVVTFITLEAQSISSELGGNDGLVGFMTSQLIQFIIRFSLESLLNALFALIWPVYLLRWLEGWGVLALIGAFGAYRYVVRPSIERWFPELREAREAKAAQKAARKAARKAADEA